MNTNHYRAIEEPLVYDVISVHLIKPDLYVYLHLSLDNLMHNIKQRGRIFEQQIPRKYRVRIKEGYMDFLKNLKNLTIVMIDINHLYFSNIVQIFEYLLQLIFQGNYALGINKVIPKYQVSNLILKQTVFFIKKHY